MTDPEPLLAAVRGAGVRLTAPRRVVAALIADRDGHFSAADLVAEARARRLGIGRATIYRALELFTALNVVERLDLPSGDHAYVACERPHHHHVVCRRCGRSAEVGDGEMDALISRIGSESGYRIDSHRLELFGLCSACTAAHQRA